MNCKAQPVDTKINSCVISPNLHPPINTGGLSLFLAALGAPACGALRCSSPAHPVRSSAVRSLGLFLALSMLQASAQD